MSLTKMTKFATLAAFMISLSLLPAKGQTGNTGGSSGGTGGGQHGEGSGPAGSVPSTGGASFIGDPDKNPYATPTPADITGGAEPAATPKHGRRRNSSGHNSDKGSRDGRPDGSPSPSPSR
jgi:hypothetical protein